MATRKNGTVIDGGSSTQGIEPQPTGDDSNHVGTPATDASAGSAAGTGPELIAGYESYDPADPGNGNAGSATGTGERKRRGRPPGSKNGSGTGTQKAATKNNLSGIENLLFSLHSMGAIILKTPELALTTAESAQLAAAVKNVADQYPVDMNPKVLAWVQLAMVAGSIYGPRIVALKMSDGKKRKGPEPVPFPTPAAAPADKSDKPKTNGKLTNPSQLFGMDYGAALAE